MMILNGIDGPQRPADPIQVSPVTGCAVSFALFLSSAGTAWSTCLLWRGAIDLPRIGLQLQGSFWVLYIYYTVSGPFLLRYFIPDSIGQKVHPKNGPKKGLRFSGPFLMLLNRPQTHDWQELATKELLFRLQHNWGALAHLRHPSLLRLCGVFPQLS